MSEHDATATNGGKTSGTDNERPRETVINSSYGWAKGKYVYDALPRFVSYVPDRHDANAPDDDGDIEFTVARVRGFNGIRFNGHSVGIDADEYIDVQRFAVPFTEVLAYKEYVSEVDYKTEDLLEDREVEE